MNSSLSFKSKLSLLLHDAFYHFSSIYDHDVVENIKTSLLPKLSEFSNTDYYNLLKMAAQYRFDRLNCSTGETLFQYIRVNLKQQFPLISLFADEITKYVHDEQLIEHFYADVEDWLMEALDEEVVSYKENSNPQLVLSESISRSDENNFWFLIFYGPVFYGCVQSEWTRYILKLVNINLSDECHLVFFNKNTEFALSTQEFTTRTASLNKLYRYLNTIHKNNINFHRST